MSLSVREVARLLRVSESTIQRWVRHDGLPAERIDKQFRFNRTDLLEWAIARKIQVPPDLFNQNENGEVAAFPSLRDVLPHEAIHYRVQGADKAAVLKAIVQKINLPDAADREMLLSVLLAREALGSTAVGDGIAIPHVRNPIVLQVQKASVTLCFLEKPIDFGALDGQPVQTLFTLICPTVRLHLHLISRLAFALRDPIMKQALKEQAPPDTLLKEIARVETSLVPSAGK